MRTIYLVDELSEAHIDAPNPQHVEIQRFTLRLQTEVAIFEHPPSKITFPAVTVGPKAALHFACGVKQPAWKRIESAVVFRIDVQTQSECVPVFSLTLNPRDNPDHRAWSRQTLDLTAYAGQTVQLIFQTTSKGRSNAYAWAGWGDVRLIDEMPVQARQPYRSTTEHHHVFLVTADALIASFLGCYGHPEVQTPAIDALAREGWLMAEARAQTTSTRGSYASLLTGKYPYEHGVDREWREMPAFIPTLPVLLNGQGYHTVLFSGKNDIDSASGFGNLFQQVFPSRSNPAQDGAVTVREFTKWLTHRPDQPIFGWLHFFDTHPPALLPEPYCTMYVQVASSPSQQNQLEQVRGVESLLEFDDALALLEKRTIPYALIARLQDTVAVLRNRALEGPDLVSHILALGERAMGKQSPMRFADWLEDHTRLLALGDIQPDLITWLHKMRGLLFEIEGEVVSWREDVADFGFVVAQMKAAVSYFDHHVANLIDALKAAGIYDQSTIIVTAPHGEVLEYQGIILNHHIPIRQVLHIPLVIKPAKSLTSHLGQVICGVFDSIDLLPTLLEMLDVPSGANLSGYSRWQSILQGETIPPHDSFAADALHLITTIYRHPYLLMHGEQNHKIGDWSWKPGDEFLFAVSSTSDETVNQLEALSDQAADLRVRLEQWRRKANLVDGVHGNRT